LNQNTLGAIVTYDLTDVDSFDKVEAWIKELRSFCSNDLPMVIVGNKCDKQILAVDVKKAER
jgi:GTPase SAR1 family protein